MSASPSALPDRHHVEPSHHERHGEPRWPAMLAVVVAASLHLGLPHSMTAGPPWLLLVVTVLLLIPTVVSHRAGRHDVNGWCAYAVNGVLTGALMYSIGMLIVELPAHREPPVVLLRVAAMLWAMTVLVFAAWYWRLDAGGPNDRDRRRRAGEAHTRGAFLFPQMTVDLAQLRDHCDVEAHWSPQFIDYLFLAFTASTAFSPTDVPVLSRWAKLLMMAQAVMSLATLALLAARAVNIL